MSTISSADAAILNNGTMFGCFNNPLDIQHGQPYAPVCNNKCLAKYLNAAVSWLLAIYNLAFVWLNTPTRRWGCQRFFHVIWTQVRDYTRVDNPFNLYDSSVHLIKGELCLANDLSKASFCWLEISSFQRLHSTRVPSQDWNPFNSNIRLIVLDFLAVTDSLEKFSGCLALSGKIFSAILI